MCILKFKWIEIVLVLNIWNVINYVDCLVFCLVDFVSWFKCFKIDLFEECCYWNDVFMIFVNCD